MGAPGTPGDINVSPDSTGKAVKNFTVTRYDPATGTTWTEYMQVVSIVSADGTPVDLDLAHLLQQLVRLNVKQVALLKIIAEDATNSNDIDVDQLIEGDEDPL